MKKLPLLIPENIKNISIENLLKLYFKRAVEFNYKCIKSNKKIKHSKEIKLVKCAEVLILSIQRINFINRDENECIINFNEKLDINDFIDKDFDLNHKTIYDLYTILNHIRIINYGHYFSLIKFKNNNIFYEFNDTAVIKNDNFNVCFNLVYSLFYIRN